MNDPLTAALEYGALGLRVVPVVGKRPAAEHGYASATADGTTIRELFGRVTATGVGIAAGDELAIVDVDRVEGLAELGPLPRTLTARSGGGGWHLYYLRPSGLRLSFRAKSFPDRVEVKLGAGGTVAPPSVHPNGRRYTWARWSPIAPAPACLVARLHCSARATDTSPFASQRPDAPTAYGRAVLDRKAQLVAQAIEGTRQSVLNGATFACAQLIPSGHLEQGVVESVLLEAAASTGLPHVEIRRTITRALAAGQARPFFPEPLA